MISLPSAPWKTDEAVYEPLLRQSSRSGRVLRSGFDPKRASKAAHMPEAPDFSVIIPTRNRHSQLWGCLEALERLNYPKTRFEVVLVDDGSQPPVESVVTFWRKHLPIELLSQPGAGPARARNYGAKIARGRFLAFTDDDCRPSPGWLDQLWNTLSLAPDSVAGGRTVNALVRNVFATASQALIGYLYDYFNGDPSKSWFLATNNFALSARTFSSLDGFDTSYPTAAAEDRDLCSRLRAAGHGMVFAPQAVVFHLHPLNPASFWTQHFEYGRGAHRYWRSKLRRSGESLRVEPLRFYSGMLSWPFRQAEMYRPLAVSALLILSQIANAAGYLWEAMAARRE